MSTTLYTIENVWAGTLSVVPRPRGDDWLEEEVADWKRSGICAVVSLLTEREIRDFGLSGEKAACNAAGIEFIHLPIEDMSVPADLNEALAALESLEDKLNHGAHVAVHCRQSIGRSGLLAASLLVLHGIPAVEAVADLSEKRGRTVPETEEQMQWLDRLAVRLEKPASRPS